MIQKDEFTNWKTRQTAQVYDTDGTIVRAIKEDEETAFVFYKRSRTYGKRLSKQSFCNIYTFKNTDDENTKWHKRIKRAIKCLESSGVNPWLLDVMKGLDKMTYDDVTEISHMWSARHPQKWDDQEYNKAYFKEWFEKYPFLENNGFLNTEYIGGISDAKLKNMSFGFSNTAKLKEEINAALKEKKDYSTGPHRGRAYDHSFYYKAETSNAIYQEEYHGCGNGHYYYALDNRTAIYSEDD